MWPFRCVAVSICGRSGLWPFRFVAFSVVAVSVCGRYDLLPASSGFKTKRLLYHAVAEKSGRHFPDEICLNENV